MASDTHRPDAADRDGTAPQPGTPSPEAQDEAGAFPPTGLVATDTWAEAADSTGTVRSTRAMPEPDSLGG